MKIKLSPTLAVLASAMTIAACGKPDAPPPPTSAAVTVKAITVANSGEDASRTYSGEVHARYELPLSFRISGKLLERPVDTGSRVGAGQVLARLDPTDVALQAAQAQSQLALAEAEARRYRDLRARNFVSAAALDAKETALKTARAQAGLANNQADYAQLKAEHAGVVAQALAEPGQVVAAGQPILRLAEDGEREVQIALPESAVSGIRVGDTATVTLWTGGKTYQGRVRELAPAADPGSRTFAARVSMLDADAAVALGMTAGVCFNTPASVRILIPLSAIYQQGNAAAAWIIDDQGKLVLRPIVVTGYTDAGAEVTSGLKVGERIVAAGVHKLVAGQTVRIGK